MWFHRLYVYKKTKKCVSCGSDWVVKRGVQDGVQTYWCRSCNKRFRSERRRNHDDLWNAYVFNKQTVRELKEQTGYDKKTIFKYLDGHEVPQKIHAPRSIHLVVDATYFGTRIDHKAWGVILFRDADQKENLWWKYVSHETALDYEEGKRCVETLGYKILSVTSDGFLGLPRVFEGIPFQMCQFHMKQIVVRNVTLKPKTEAGKVLLAIAKTLSKTDQETFNRRLLAFHSKYASFLMEKTIHPDGSWSYTHEGSRRAYVSLLHWREYLFTYLKNPGMPNTTNTCDGHFSHIKDVVRIHRGLCKSFKQKVLDAILLESTIAPKKKKN